MRKYLTEFVGTFFLVLTIGLTVTAGTPFAPLAIGLALMTMVYMGGHVSGAHYNPAVSFALLIRGALPRAEFLPYVASQILGATAAAAVVRVLTGQTFAPAPGATATTAAALLAEILLTFALALVVLNVATSSKTQNNSYYGLAIGMTVTVGAFAVGGISGGAFNPAVGIGPTVINATLGAGTWANLWLYLVGPLVGGTLAAFAFKTQEQS
jgi:aquaporin Z